MLTQTVCYQGKQQAECERRLVDSEEIIWGSAFTVCNNKIMQQEQVPASGLQTRHHTSATTVTITSTAAHRTEMTLAFPRPI